MKWAILPEGTEHYSTAASLSEPTWSTLLDSKLHEDIDYFYQVHHNFTGTSTVSAAK